MRIYLNLESKSVVYVLIIRISYIIYSSICLIYLEFCGCKEI